VPQRNLTGTLDRPHRFKVGDILVHKDVADKTDVRDQAYVHLLTVRIHDLGFTHFMCYPTYVLVPMDNGEDVMNDILCTEDLVKVGEVA